MISLQQSSEPFKITLLAGITFTVMPLTSFEMQVARHKAQRIIDDIKNSIITLTEAGFNLPDTFDSGNPDHIAALRDGIIVRELAQTKVIDWCGIKNAADGSDVPFDKKILTGLMNDHLISDAFYAAIMKNQLMRLAAKKGSGTGSTGNTAPVPNTVADATNREQIAHKAVAA